MFATGAQAPGQHSHTSIDLLPGYQWNLGGCHTRQHVYQGICIIVETPAEHVQQGVCGVQGGNSLASWRCSCSAQTSGARWRRPTRAPALQRWASCLVPPGPKPAPTPRRTTRSCTRRAPPPDASPSAPQRPRACADCSAWWQHCSAQNAQGKCTNDQLLLNQDCSFPRHPSYVLCGTMHCPC